MGANIADRFLQAGVNSDNFLVGPSVLFLQNEDDWPSVLTDGSAFPRYMDDVVNITTGVAMSANGWEYLGYTENVQMGRNRSVVFHDADQQARVEEVHDTWENMLTFDSLEFSPDKLKLFWQGDEDDPTVVTGAPTPQSSVDFGDPTTITRRRVALLHVDKNAYGHMFVYRKANLIATGGPTFSRTGKLAIPIKIDALPDTRVADVDKRAFKLFHTTGPIT